MEVKNETELQQAAEKKEIGAETFIFLAIFIGFFAIFVSQMGLLNTINTLMNTAFDLLINTVLFLTALCVLMGAISELFSEFGVVSLANRLLNPLMMPLYGLPGAASVGVVTTFLSDNPAILALADNRYFKSRFKKYQFPALTNLGTSFGMGLVVCTFMISLSTISNVDYSAAVLVGLLGAVVGSIVSTRIMLFFTTKMFGREEEMVPHAADEDAQHGHMRTIRPGGTSTRFIGALLDGGASGVKVGVSIVPGVLIICTIVMMLTNSPGADGYTGAAYEGVGLLPFLADKCSVVLNPLFGFSSPEAIGVPITALGAAGAATSVAKQLVTDGLVGAGDIAVFTSMCMCWSGYLSTHVSMMNSLDCNQLINKAIISHTIGGLCAGVAAHWIYVLVSMIM